MSFRRYLLSEVLTESWIRAVHISLLLKNIWLRNSFSLNSQTALFTVTLHLNDNLVLLFKIYIFFKSQYLIFSHLFFLKYLRAFTNCWINILFLWRGI